MSQPLPEPLRFHCGCKALSATVVASPMFGTGTYCHCTGCQRRFGAPYSSFALFASSSIKWDDNPTQTLPITQQLVPTQFKLVPDWDGETDAPKSNGNASVDCTRCGGRIGFYLATLGGAICVNTGAFERDEARKIKGWEVIKPGVHIFYHERVVDVKDGLKKWAGHGPGSQELEE